MNIGKRACALARSASAAALSLTLALTMLPNAAIADTSGFVGGGGFSVESPEAEDTALSGAGSAESGRTFASEKDLQESNDESETAPYGTALEANEADPGSAGSDAEAPADGTSSADGAIASGIISEEHALAPIAQAESTRSYLLAQTLESTRTVPVVSAKLPVAGDGTDEVLGSFTYRGITYAVEPGGESVAIVAADHSKLPQDFLEAQTIVLPSSVSFDGIDSYSVSRIANGAFSSLTKTAASASEGSEEAGAFSDAQVSDVADRSDASSGASDDNDASLDAPGEGAGLGSAIDEGPAFDPDIEDAPSTGIIAVTIPASVTSIEDGAFAGFDTLQYVIVSDDNPNYSMHDGCLYDEPLESLLLIPEGRLGAVRIPSTAVTIPEDVVSHCAYVTSFIVDADSAASQLLEGDGFHNAKGDAIKVEAERPLGAGFSVAFTKPHIIQVGETLSIASEMVDAADVALSSDVLLKQNDDSLISTEPGECTVAMLHGRSGEKGVTIVDVRVEGIRDTRLEAIQDEACASQDSKSDTSEKLSLISVDDPISDRASFASVGLTTVLKLGERDASGNPTGKGGDISFSNTGTESGCYMYGMAASGGGIWADITWTGGGSAPATGSTVNVSVLKLMQTGEEATIETINTQAISKWGASASKRFVGARNTTTGSFISVSALAGEVAFSFSFQMPSSGCSITAPSSSSPGSFIWHSSGFTPVYESQTNSVPNRFSLNAPVAMARWKNAVTGLTNRSNSFQATTYSTKDGALTYPQNAIPYCPGYVFKGWYTTSDGTTPAPSNTTASGATYYAQWGPASPTSIKLGERDASGNPTGKGGDISFSNTGTAAGCYMYGMAASGGGIWADITWTGGGSAPATGSTVNVSVLKLMQTGEEATIETINTQAISKWGASASKRFVGARNTTTGSFIAVEALACETPFSFSFVMPSSGCSVTAPTETTTGSLTWHSSGFAPVYEPQIEGVLNHFDLNAPTGAARWKSATTGLTTNSSIFQATTYSTKDGALVFPQNAVPLCAGYTFKGWYTSKTGAEAAPSNTTASGATYYAQWGPTSPTSIKLGERDASGNPTGKGADISFSNTGTAVGCYMYGMAASGGGIWADITWTGNTTAPASGSTVNVSVLKLMQTGEEATIETINTQAISSWGASASKRFVGIRNEKTGSFISIEALAGESTFSFSFVMPASGCAIEALNDIDAGSFSWYSSGFVPVYEPQTDTILNYFDLNAPISSARWKSAVTGLSTFSSTFKATTYSTKNGALVLPQSAIPVCEGFTFKGWFKERVGGDPAPDMTTDAGTTYYAQWEDNLETCYLVTLNSNVPGNEEMESGYIRGGHSLTLNGDVYERVGYSLTGWATSKDGPASHSAYANITGAAGQTISLYAQWTLDKYTINYVLDGGSWESGTTAPAFYEYATGLDALTVPNPARIGYDFAGWTGPGLEGPVIDLRIDQGSNDKLGEHEAGTNVYARSYIATWTPHTYAMSFDLAFGDGSASWKDGEAPATGAYDAIAYDTAVTFPKAPVRAGWIFTGWAPVEADADKDSYAAEETVDPANFASEQEAVASFEAHWVRNIEVSVPLGSKDVGLSVSADLVEGTEFDVGKGTSEIVNLSDGELKVVSVREDTADADALSIRKANALEVFGGASSNASKVEAVSFVLRPTSDGTTPDASKEEARFPLFGSHAFTTDTWRIPASSGATDGTDAPSLRILYDLAFDYSKIAITDLKLNLDAKPISSLVFTVELVDPTEPSYSASA